MKTSDFLRTSAFILLPFLAVQPALGQKPAIKCPDFQKTGFENKLTKKKKENHKTYSYSQSRSAVKRKNQSDKPAALVQRPSSIANRSKVNDTRSLTDFERVSNLSKLEFKNSQIASLNNPELTLHEGSDVIYNHPGTEKTVISKIRGKDFYIIDNPVDNAVLQQTEAQKIEGLGLAGMIVGLAGFFIAGIPCGVIAIVFGSISLVKIKSHPERFRGKGFSIASLVIGIVVLALTIAVLV